MAPPVEKFVSRMRAMGIGDGHQVVVYDGMGLFSAPRVWWTFRLMGKTDVAVLDGGFAKWQAEGRPVEDMPPMLRDRHITVQRQAGSGQGCNPGGAGVETGRAMHCRCAVPGRFARG
jgi:thiosulfate/3-mercaptopyruvate sulfurtransferase